MKSKPSLYSHKASKTFYFIAVISYTLCLLFFLPDNIKYARWGIIKTDSVTSLFVYSSLCLYLFNKLPFKTAAFIYVYAALLNIVFSSWIYFYTITDYSEIILICTSIYCINLAIGGLCIGFRHAYYAAILYIVGIAPLMYISDDPLLNRYWIIICTLMATFSGGISGFLYLLEKAYQRELQLKEQIHQNEKALAWEHEKLLTSQLDFKQKEIMTKTMFLAEYAECNNRFIQKLNQFKAILVSKDQKLLESIIDSYSIHHSEQCWRDFETSFIEINPDFQQKLFKLCPDLTPAECKLAKLIHLGLSSKQIASLNANTPESIDVARSRLRTKLNLTSETNLKSYLLNI